MDLSAENIRVFLHDIKTQPNTNPRRGWIDVMTPAKSLENRGHLLLGNSGAGVRDFYFQRLEGA